MLKRFFILFSFLFIILPSPSFARVYLDINNPTFVQIPIVLAKWKSVDKTPPTLTQKLYDILANDLTLSGFFKVTTYQNLPRTLQEKEGIPNTLFLQEWTSANGDFLLTGDASLQSSENYVKLRFHLFDLIEQKHLVGSEIQGPIASLRLMVHRISDQIILQLTGEKGVLNTKLAYCGVQGGKEIFIADFDGFSVTQLTQNQSINLSPVWLPGGKAIAFTSYLRRNPDLYLIDADGKNFRRFSSRPGLNLAPSWSPDGKQIVLMMGMEGKSDIYVMDASGNNPKKLTKGSGNEASPRWSPDGQSITFVSDRSGSPQIYIMGSDGSNVRRLTFEGNYNTSPSWSPKGDRIAFCSRIEGRFNICTIGTDGSGLQRLTSNSGNNESPCWSPDGRYIAFSSTRAGGSKIYMMHANGFNQRQLNPSKGVSESSPSWSNRFD
jgi:TolB protein